MSRRLPLWRLFRRSTVAVAALCCLSAPSFAEQAAGEERPALARVEVTRPLAELGLPVLAHLVDGAGREYVLVAASEASLQASGAPYCVLDAEFNDAGYLLVTLRHVDREPLIGKGRRQVLLDDGRRFLLRDDSEVRRELEQAAAHVLLLDGRPLDLRVPEVMPQAAPLSYDALVAEMVAAVEQTTVVSYDRQLSGADPATVGGSPYTIATRHTNSGTPIQKATQYVYEHLERVGLTPSYHSWTRCGTTGRNVIGAWPGVAAPDEIVLITAHLDDMPAGASAPGADDNASGSVAVMLAAQILTGYRFERTVRFVVFTGEEQGLCGSYAYAAAVKTAGDNIVAVFNLDMIAYENVGEPILDLHTRPTSSPGYPADRQIADTFTDAVGLYGLSTALAPMVLTDGITYSDHAEFWSRGYAAVLGIEDDDDFTPYYHTANDKIGTLDQGYFTAFVKAGLATVAHLAVPVEKICSPPEAPAVTAPTAASSGTAYQLTWTASSPVGEYQLEEATDSSFTSSLSVAVSGESQWFTHTVGEGGTYYYRVRARSECDDGLPASEWSDTVQVSVEAEEAGCSLTIEEQTIDWPAAFESCGEIAAGPNTGLGAAAQVVMRAATAVKLRNGFHVAEGAVLTAGVDAALASP